MRKSAFPATLLSALCLSATFLGAQSLPMGPQLDAGASLVIERGPVSARFAPALSLGAALSLPMQSASLYATLRGSAGSFLGQVLALEWGGGLAWDGPGAWEPRMGAVFTIDGGSWIFGSEGSTVLPPPTQVYVGLALEPLRFRAGRYAVSVGSLRASVGLEGSWRVLRVETGLLSLGWGTDR